MSKNILELAQEHAENLSGTARQEFDSSVFEIELELLKMIIDSRKSLRGD
jgi:hypothetical protein